MKKTEKKFVKGKLYKGAWPYDSTRPEYTYYKPVSTGDWDICDCWLCDSKGRKHPGFRMSPVPMNRSVLTPVS